MPSLCCSLLVPEEVYCMDCEDLLVVVYHTCYEEIGHTSHVAADNTFHVVVVVVVDNMADIALLWVVVVVPDIVVEVETVVLHMVHDMVLGNI